MLALRYLATGAPFNLVCDCVQVYRTTASRATWRVIDAILKPDTFSRFVNFPSTDELGAIKSGIFDKFGLPGCIGFIDGTLIPISPYALPELERQNFICRKGFLALNVMVVCDDNRKIRAATVQHPGSAHDSYVFRCSALHKKLENGKTKGYLLGDR